jgi:hypothetical protein
MSSAELEFKPNCIKRPLPARVTFAAVDGTLATLEGPVQYKEGDALMTGVSGEHWPIRRSTFEATYQPSGLQLMGEGGTYLKKPMPVQATQIMEPMLLNLDGHRGTLNGKPGDWFLKDALGRQWVVANEIFIATYEILDLLTSP